MHSSYPLHPFVVPSWKTRDLYDDGTQPPLPPPLHFLEGAHLHFRLGHLLDRNPYNEGMMRGMDSHGSANRRQKQKRSNSESAFTSSALREASHCQELRMLWGASYCLEASHCRELLIVRRLLRLRIHCRELLIVVSFALSGASHCCDLLSLSGLLVSHCWELLIVWEASHCWTSHCQELLTVRSFSFFGGVLLFGGFSLSGASQCQEALTTRNLCHTSRRWQNCREPLIVVRFAPSDSRQENCQ